jgi:hypothetical protein
LLSISLVEAMGRADAIPSMQRAFREGVVKLLLHSGRDPAGTPAAPDDTNASDAAWLNKLIER